jgi:hypothetical protein
MLNKEKTIIVRLFSVFSFSQYGPGDLHALQAAFLLLPKRLGEVRRRAISHSPISALPGGLLSENEAG